MAFVVVEAVYGVLSHSTALLADAAHNLSDVLGLGLAWGASAMARRRPSSRHTYGLRKTTVLAALANGMLLLTALGGVAWEAIQRFSEQTAIPGKTVMAVALVGVLINGVSAALFVSRAKTDVNVRGALVHLLTDAAVSVGVVVVGAVLILRPNWLWLDPAVSLAISAIVAVATWQLLRDAVHLSLDGVPPGIDVSQVLGALEALPGVVAVHDLHIWALSTSETALTAHLVIDTSAPPELAAMASQTLDHGFGIEHSTLQLDTPEQAADCHSC